jgi:hypothetical protein
MPRGQHGGAVGAGGFFPFGSNGGADLGEAGLKLRPRRQHDDARRLQRRGLDRHFLDRHFPAALLRDLGRIGDRLLLGRRQFIERRLVQDHDVARQPGLDVDVMREIILRLGVDAGRGRGDHHVNAAGGKRRRQIRHLDLDRDRAGERRDAADDGVVLIRP